jgi:hypothetical protein
MAQALASAATLVQSQDKVFCLSVPERIAIFNNPLRRPYGRSERISSKSVAKPRSEKRAVNMNIFDYFDEEESDIEKKLKELTENYEVWTREQVFDRVKAVCDAIMGHLKKQSLLILKNFTPGNEELISLFREAQKDHMVVNEEIGQLVEVHVDEPNYDECLASLLKVMETHIEFSKRLYAGLKANLSTQELDNLNAQFSDMVLHATEFNTLQAPQ